MEELRKGKVTDLLAKAVRALTVPPVLAILAVLLIYFHDEPIAPTYRYFMIVVFVALIPLLAYPVQFLLPKYKNEGRKGQRKLAFIFSGIGYFGGLVYAIIMKEKGEILSVYLCYALSLFILTVFNKGLKIRASGHACGIVGPLALCVMEVSLYCLIPASIIFALMVWSSLRLKRHTPSELVYGSLSALFSVLIVFLGMSFL